MAPGEPTAADGATAAAASPAAPTAGSPTTAANGAATGTAAIADPGAERPTNRQPGTTVSADGYAVAILDQTGISPETYRQRLRRERYAPGDRPRVVAQRIRDLCWRWLEPEYQMSVQVAEMVALEHFQQILPTGRREWVQRITW
uniref:SCAN box domain-containing protein n=1 Tax=Terrapene triunguis TaxID=2587831 RepID=A0A674J531_9SAUR